jgi:hypothetical protein
MMDYSKGNEIMNIDMLTSVSGTIGGGFFG